MTKLSHIYLKDIVHRKQMRRERERATLIVDTNLRADEAKVYSITTFIPARKRFTGKVDPAKIPLKC